jgi:hypothetical protein
MSSEILVPDKRLELLWVSPAASKAAVYAFHQSGKVVSTSLQSCSPLALELFPPFTAYSYSGELSIVFTKLYISLQKLTLSVLSMY